MMKKIYFVTEGLTDRMILESLIDHWLNGEEYIPRYIQPPSSDYADGLDSNLSEGWKGVRDWCSGRRMIGAAGRDEAVRHADCLIIHLDADVAYETEFKSPRYTGPCPPAEIGCEWIRDHLVSFFGGVLPESVVLCVPSQDIESWVLCALHPEIADQNSPIECKRQPGRLLVQRPPHRLLRMKNNRMRKVTSKYATSLKAIVAGWEECAGGDSPRCLQARRFERDVKRVLGM